MNFKNLVLAYLMIGMPIYSNADLKEIVKNRYRTTHMFVQHNYYKIAQLTAGSLCLAGGSCVVLHGLSTIFKMPKDLDQRDVGARIAMGSALSAIYCGYHTINAALDNKINTRVKNILARSKTPLREEKINQQK